MVIKQPTQEAFLQTKQLVWLCIVELSIVGFPFLRIQIALFVGPAQGERRQQEDTKEYFLECPEHHSSHIIIYGTG